VAGTVLDGGTGDDIVVGDGGDDTLIGGADDDLLIGRRGDDALYGGTGSDTYLYARGDGWDTLYSSNEPADSSSTFTSDPGQADGGTPQTSIDVLVLDGGISRQDVWFWRDGNDLRVGAGAWNGNSLGVSGGVAVSGWTAGDRDALDRIVSSDGYTLDASRIDRLVSAMAAFGAPGAGSITLTQQQRDSVNAVIAQSWQSAA
jgi:Ca2+-binding RTX toxin-like protein